MYRLSLIVTVETSFISNSEMTTKDKCDYKLMKECFFEILANSDEDYACKICRAAVLLDPLNAGQVLGIQIY